MDQKCVNEEFVYPVTLKQLILRLLILGSRKNNYNTQLKNLTKEDSDYIKQEIQNGKGGEILDIVREVYAESRAPKQEVTMLMMALLCRAADVDLRLKSLALLKEFRTISHLYSWKNCHASIDNPLTGQPSKGFGRAVKRAINEWALAYKDKPKELAYQITKYMTREGWSFKNILQCTHLRTKTGDDRLIAPAQAKQTPAQAPKAQKGQGNANDVPPAEIDLVLRYAVNGFAAMEELAKKSGLADIENGVYIYLKAVHDAKHFSETEENKAQLIELIHKHRLAREQVPTWALADTDTLLALLVNKKKTQVTMPLTALLRNLGSMTSHQVLADEEVLQVVQAHLLNPITIEKSRVHPVTVLMAWFNYRNGCGLRGQTHWIPHPSLVKTLEEMFYLSFKNVEPTDTSICFLIDGSGSMTAPSLCEGVSNAEAAALLAMIFARSETKKDAVPNHAFYIFTASKIVNYRTTTGLTDVSDAIHAEATLDQVLQAVQRSDWGMTDISSGILEALKYKRKYGAFVVITDNDVNSGIKPSEAMQQYRTGMKLPNTKLAVIATQGTNLSIADPADPLMLDMVGFDSHGPKILQDFIRFK